MNDHAAETPQQLLDRMESQAQRFTTPCGDGQVIWHMWDQSGGTAPVVVLFHGGAGSWRHWVRNIPALAPLYRVLIPDLPGLGESDMPPGGDDPEAMAQIIVEGIDRIVGPETTYDIVGFSFGGTIAACVGALGGARVRSVTVLGSSAVGNLVSAVKLEKVRHLEGQERIDTHRINLSRLMIADPAKIDDLALVIQDWNTIRSRLHTPPISRSGAITRGLSRITAPINGMWGELDAPANPKGKERIEAMLALRPDADVRLIPGAGHWVAYEAAEIVNPILLEMLARTRP